MRARVGVGGYGGGLEWNGHWEMKRGQRAEVKGLFESQFSSSIIIVHSFILPSTSINTSKYYHNTINININSTTIETHSNIVILIVIIEQQTDGVYALWCY